MNEKNYRNQRLLDLAREAPHCMSCGEKQYGQVVACHSNLIKHGKGTGIKAHDLVAYLCADCHSIVDGRTGTRTHTPQDRLVLFYEALYETWLWLMREGHLK